MRRVLITRFSALGDVAMTVPVVTEVCRENPGDRFVMLTRKHPAQLFTQIPENLTVETFDPDSYKGLSGLLRLWRGLQARYRFTDFVDLHDVFRTRMLRLYARMSGVRVSTVDKGRAAKRRLTRRRHKALVPLRHTALRYADAFTRSGFKCAGFKFEGATPAFTCRGPQPAVSSPLKSPAAIAIAPFAKHPGKIYPAELMEKVVARLAARPDTRLYIFGFGDEETAVIAGWAAEYGNIENMAQKRLGLRKELEVIASCRVMLSMDSANMHLASLVGTPVVSIWGATHPYAGFLGIGQREEDAVQLPLPCRPCSVFGDRKCRRGDYQCLRGISPETILQRIEHHLNTNI